MHFESHFLTLWLEEFSTQIGAKLALNERGQCGIKTNHDLNIVLQADQQGLCCWFSLQLIKVSASSAAMLRKALELNLFQTQARGAVVTVDENKKHLVLNYRLATEGNDAASFIRTLKSLTRAAADIRGELGAESRVEDELQALPIPNMHFLRA